MKDIRAQHPLLAQKLKKEMVTWGNKGLLLELEKKEINIRIITLNAAERLLNQNMPAELPLSKSVNSD